MVSHNSFVKINCSEKGGSRAETGGGNVVKRNFHCCEDRKNNRIFIMFKELYNNEKLIRQGREGIIAGLISLSR